MYLAPRVGAAVSSATYRPVPESLLASTRSILQSGQIAETMSTSRDSSSVQSSSVGAVGGGRCGQVVRGLELRRPVALTGGDRVWAHGLRGRMGGHILDDQALLLSGREGLAAGKHPVVLRRCRRGGGYRCGRGGSRKDCRRAYC